MAKRTGPSNPHLRVLIQELKKTAIQQAVPLWKRIASDLERPTRIRRAVNLSRINRFTKDSEVIIVPGKVLGSGAVDHKLTIAALSFSEGATTKLKKMDCELLSINELIERNPKASKVRIIG